MVRLMQETWSRVNGFAGLSPRAGHDPERIKYLHGSLFEIKCSSSLCDYTETNNFIDPIVPALAIPVDESEMFGQKADGKPKELDIADERVKLAQIPTNDLPQCPKCNCLLRPGVVWFGESLPEDVLDDVEEFIESSAKIDLMIVVGTSAVVWPAAGYIETAKAKGARVAVINMDAGTGSELSDDDWFFEGDASTIVPALFREEVGDLEWHVMQMS